jgi:hypothetical protein
VARKEWRKPQVKRLKAGAAEVNTNTIRDDADQAAVKDNS